MFLNAVKHVNRMILCFRSVFHSPKEDSKLRNSVEEYLNHRAPRSTFSLNRIRSDSNLSFNQYLQLEFSQNADK